MPSPKSTYFAFPFHEDQFIIGTKNENWFWFYDKFVEGNQQLYNIDLSQSKVLFLNHFTNPAILEGILDLNEDQILASPQTASQNQGEIVFDEKENLFITKEGEKTRPSTHQESLFYADVIASQYTTNEALKLRIMEMKHGFIPSFQYQIEQTYRSFFQAHLTSAESQIQPFTTKERKKAFDRIFKEKIVPFAGQHGFERHTKTSKRLVKPLENGLSVFIFFEHKNFGEGSYEASVVYFEEEIANYENDLYLARIHPNFPYSSNLMIDSPNQEVLEHEINYWMRIMELYILPFIERNHTHQAILETIRKKKIIDQKRTEMGIGKLARKPSYSFELSHFIKKNETLWKLFEQK